LLRRAYDDRLLDTYWTRAIWSSTGGDRDCGCGCGVHDEIATLKRRVPATFGARRRIEIEGPYDGDPDVRGIRVLVALLEQDCERAISDLHRHPGERKAGERAAPPRRHDPNQRMPGRNGGLRARIHLGGLPARAPVAPQRRPAAARRAR
jgi:hypothetical protein